MKCCPLSSGFCNRISAKSPSLLDSQTAELRVVGWKLGQAPGNWKLASWAFERHFCWPSTQHIVPSSNVFDRLAISNAIFLCGSRLTLSDRIFELAASGGESEVRRELLLCLLVIVSATLHKRSSYCNFSWSDFKTSFFGFYRDKTPVSAKLTPGLFDVFPFTMLLALVWR